MPFLRRILLLSLALVALGAPAAAQAATPEDILIDCNDDGDLDRNYSDRDLRRALNQLQSDQAEYSNCTEVINAAFGGGRGGAGPGGGGGAGSPGSPGSAAEGSAIPVPQPTADDLNQLAERRRAGQDEKAPEVAVAGRRLTPGSAGVKRTAAAANSLPFPLILLLIAVALLFAAGTLPAARRPLAGASRVARRILRR